MKECLYPNCEERPTVFCICHLDRGYWCLEHIDNHYEAMKKGMKNEIF